MKKLPEYVEENREMSDEELHEWYLRAKRLIEFSAKHNVAPNAADRLKYVVGQYEAKNGII